MMSARWSGDEIVRLRRLMADPAVLRSAIPDMLGRSADAVRKMVELLGIGSPAPSTRPGDGWTAEQLATLRRMWRTHERHEIAEAVGRTIAAVSRKANNLRLGPRIVSPARDAAHKAQALEAVRKAREAQAAKRAANPMSPREPVFAPALVDRKCLRCSKAFQAPTRFLRLCDYCRTNNSGGII